MRGVRRQHGERAEPDTPEKRPSRGRRAGACCCELARNGGGRRRGFALPPLHAMRTHDSKLTHPRAAGLLGGRATPLPSCQKRMAPRPMLRVEWASSNRWLRAGRRLPPACGFRAIAETPPGVSRIGAAPSSAMACVPDAVQRVALAERCTADPGLPGTRYSRYPQYYCFVRSRVCSAPVRCASCCAAPGTRDRNPTALRGRSITPGRNR